MSSFQYILSVALGQGIILAFFLLTSKYYKSIANTWLAAALVLLSFISITDLASSDYAPSSMLLEFFLHDLELGFLIYVLLHYFFKISTSSSPREEPLNFYLFLPFIIDTIINIGIVCYFPIKTIASNFGVQLFYEIETLSCILFNSWVSYKSYQLIKAYERNSDKKNWIYKIWQSTFILLIAWILMALGSSVASEGLSFFVHALYILIAIWMFWLIYNGIVNLKLIEDRKNISLKLEDRAIQSIRIPSNPEERASQEEISETKASQIQQKPARELLDSHFEKINALMVAESLYRNEDLSIEDVAQRIEMSTGYVSKIIKKATNKNFPIWINEFRVAEVKAMFEDNDFNNYTTLSIGLEAGFKSKSAFYATFKKITGETPAKFRKKKS